MHKYIAYVDGACSGNPGPGGWAAIYFYDDIAPEVLTGSSTETTNNRMEILAAIKLLEKLTDFPVEVLTDSKYLLDGINSWVPKWKANGWRTAKRDPVKNRDLWERLDRVNRSDVTWRWVEGHSSDKFNKLADKLAVEACRMQSGDRS